MVIPSESNAARICDAHYEFVFGGDDLTPKLRISPSRAMSEFYEKSVTCILKGV